MEELEIKEELVDDAEISENQFLGRIDRTESSGTFESVNGTSRRNDENERNLNAEEKTKAFLMMQDTDVGEKPKSPVLIRRGKAKPRERKKSKGSIPDGGRVVVQFKCSLCDFQTISRSNLKRHVHRVHLKDSQYKCKTCMFTSSYPDLFACHMEKVHRKELKCSQCHYVTSFRADLIKHVGLLHSGPHFKCTLCKYRTDIGSKLEQHVDEVHFDKKRLEYASCSYFTYNQKLLDKHEKSHTWHVCPICRYSTNLENSFKMHMQRVHLQSPKMCPSCEYTTYLQQNLDTHILDVHLKAERLKCSHCDYETYDKENLTTHVDTTHSVLEKNNPSTIRKNEAEKHYSIDSSHCIKVETHS